MSEVHAGQFDDALFSQVILPLELKEVTVRRQQDCQLFVVLLSPLHHHHNDVLARVKSLLKYDMLLIAVAPRYPAVAPVVLLLHQQTPHPQVLSDTALPVEAILFLLEVEAALCFLEESEGA